MKKVYERGKVRKTQYAQNDAGNWYCRSTGGQRMSTRWTRCREGWVPNLNDYEVREMEINLPR